MKRKALFRSSEKSLRRNAVLILILFFSISGGAQNLFVNEGLDVSAVNCATNNATNNTSPDFWTKTNTPDRSTDTQRAWHTTKRNRPPSPSGGCYFGFRALGGAPEGIAQNVTLELNKEYSFTFDYLIETQPGQSSCTPELQLIVGGIVVATIQPPASENVWTRPTATFVSPLGGVQNFEFFSGGSCSTTWNFVDDLILKPACNISAMSIANVSTCNNNGTYFPTTGDDFFTADITVTFENPPSTGVLELTGDATISVPVGSLDSATSHTFVGVSLSADGTAVDVTANFTGEGMCSFTETNLTTAPNACSDPVADVSINKYLVDSSPYQIGDPVTFTIEVSNAGPSTATNVVVSDTPLNVTITSVSGAGCTSFPCTIASLPSGAANTQTITVNGTINNVGLFANGATVLADEFDPDTTNNQDLDSNLDNQGTAFGTPELTLTKAGAYTTGTGTAVGDVITYTLTVTNTGNVTVSNIEVTDANAVIVSGNPIVSLAPGASSVVTATHTITQMDLDSGSVVNTATATGDSPSGTDDVSDVSDSTNPSDDTGADNDATTTSTTSSPELTLTKAGAYTTGTGTAVGDVITYTLTVTNTGNVTVSNIEVTDANAVIVSGNPIVSLAPGASSVVTATHTITQMDLDSGSVVNTATATGDSPSGTDDVSDVSDSTNPSDDTGSGDDATTTSTTSSPELTLTKAGAYTTGTGTAVGDVITYTLTVTNTGNVTVSNIEVTDANAVIVSGNPIVSLAPGASSVVTATHTITQMDLDSGSVVNTATATGDSPSGTDDVSDVSDSTNPSDDTGADDDVTVMASVSPIVAENDFQGPIAGVNVPILNVINVLDNDILGTQTATIPQVTVSVVTPDPLGFIQLHADGSVDVAANTPPGTYSITYQICQTSNPTNCDTAIVEIEIEAPSITVTATSVCFNDTPYLSYEVVLNNFSTSELVTIEWKDASGSVIQTDVNQPLVGQILWAGAAIDGAGNPIDWPGWVFENGVWVEQADGFEGLRPSATITMSINPSETVTINYPPPSILCLAGPRMNVTYTQENILCDTEAGEIDLSVSAGIAPYTYSWSTVNGSGIVQGEQDQTGLTIGTYSVTVTDAIGETILLDILIEELQTPEWQALDCDGDGVTNGQEILDGTGHRDVCDYDPSNQDYTATSQAYQDADCDGDGVTNADEIDPDGNGIDDGNGTNPLDLCDYNPILVTGTPTAAWLISDCDGDGVTNGQELADGTDPLDECSLVVTSQDTTPSIAWEALDCDGDGVTNGQELTDGTDPLDGCSLVVASQSTTPSVAWETLDCDGDGVSNGQELADGTDIFDLCDLVVASQDTTPSVDWEQTDCDGDGVTNGFELIDGTDPLDGCSVMLENATLPQTPAWEALDCDGDGVTNGQELTDGTDPLDECSLVVASQDTTPSVAWEVLDCDGDGVTNGQELTDGTDPLDGCSLVVASQSTTPSVAWEALDCDGDGVTNGQELADGTDIFDLCDLVVASQDTTPSVDWEQTDCDGDGVTNGFELIDGTDPLDGCSVMLENATLPQTPAWEALDCDGDGVTNGQELADGTDPLDGCDYEETSQVISQVTEDWLLLDCDNDGLSNGDEISIGTDPLNPDSDGDGVIDGDEVHLDNTDPLDGCSLIVSSQTMTPTDDWNMADCDGDGVANGLEINDNTNVLDGCDFILEHQDLDAVSEQWLLEDCDNDGIANGDELGDINNNGVSDHSDINNGDPNAPDGLEVFDIMTPNGDGLNDVFSIRGIDQYPNNSVQIFNRWGVKIFDAIGYGQNGIFFRGYSDGRSTINRGEMVPVGTYFYIVTYVNNSGETIQLSGPLYINRK